MQSNCFKSNLNFVIFFIIKHFLKITKLQVSQAMRCCHFHEIRLTNQLHLFVFQVAVFVGERITGTHEEIVF